jgi:hypothetical protein
MIDSRTTSRALALGALTCFAAALIAAVPAPAHAQFGKLLKKAKEQVSNNPSSDPSVPHYDETTIELGPDQVAQVIKGLQAEQQVLEGTNGNSLQAITQHAEAVDKQLDAMYTSDGNERETYNNEVNRINTCRSDVMDRRQQQNQAKFQAQAASPEFRAKYMQLAHDMAMAQAKGDTAGVRKIREQMIASASPDVKADTAAADKECGRPPAEPRRLVVEDSLRALGVQLHDEMRERQQRAATAGVRGSGLTDLQYATARERIVGYLRATQSGGRVRGFSQKELDALNAQSAELKRLVST